MSCMGLTTEAILSSVEIVTESGCWIWMKHIEDAGYGKITHRYKDTDGSTVRATTRAHRASFMVFKGEIPDGFFVCHKCDVRSCVNPDHLFYGLPKENSSDCVNKGRTQKGELSKSSKLSEVQVLEIRNIGKTMRQVDMALAFGVSQNVISAILRRKLWSHI